MLVDGLVERLALNPTQREKAAGYVNRMETGSLRPGRSTGACGRWAETPRARVADLVAWRPRPATAGPAYYRLSRLAGAVGAESRIPPADGWDEINELFIGGR